MKGLHKEMNVSENNKTPERTMRWVHVCSFVDREMKRLQTTLDREERNTLRHQIREYISEEREKAYREGYFDTVQYLEHCANDLRDY